MKIFQVSFIDGKLKDIVFGNIAIPNRFIFDIGKYLNLWQESWSSGLLETTQVQEVVSSNPGAVNRMDMTFFHVDLL